MSDRQEWITSDFYWMEGRTLQRDDGTYLARVISDHPSRNTHAVRVAGHWEIEGYGITAEAALADLDRKVFGGGPMGEDAVRQALATHDRTVRLSTLDVLEEMLRQRDDVAWADDDATFQEIVRFRAALADPKPEP